MSLVDTLGPQLLAGKSVVPTAGVLQSAKFVGFYFSAHWCGPCRNFTPMLAQVYSYLRGQGMQIIFVSSDNNEVQFNEYYSQMPWKAMQFHRNRNALQTQFGVQGIPMLVILHADLQMATTTGVDLLRSDPSGQALLQQLQASRPLPSLIGSHLVTRAHSAPSSLSPMFDVFGPDLLCDGGRGVAPTTGVLKTAKFVALYFSAHWCGPCKMFTPILTQAYKYLRGQAMQIIFVSWDRTESQFNDYYSQMPWKAMQFNRDRDSLRQRFQVEGIPALIILHPDGRLASRMGVETMRADPSGHTLIATLQQS